MNGTMKRGAKEARTVTPAIISTSADAHTAEEIVARTKERFDCAADDCVLFMAIARFAEAEGLEATGELVGVENGAS